VTFARRGFLRLAPAALGLVVAGCAAGSDSPVVVAAGEPGGFYVEFAGLLVRQLEDAGIPARVAVSGGSVDNVHHVADGTAALGLVLTDIALAARRGDAPFEPPVDLRAIGRVYENYMQLVVRAGDPISDAADLVGRRVSLGAEGSGAAVFGDRLLEAVGVAAQVTRRPLREAVAALEAGATDALLWSGGVPTPALGELAARRPVRLVPLARHLPALRARHGSVYGPVAVPAGVYGARGPVPTVGVANLLVAAATLPDGIAGAVARTLVGAAPALVPSAALGTQYLDQRSLIGTGEIPLHPGAVAAYRALHG
jgi:TRAP transporter TAXI family solute receptor